MRHPGRDAGYANLDLADVATSHVVSRSLTAGQGTTALHLPVAIPYAIRVDSPPYAIEDRRYCYAGDEVMIRLRVGATVRGVARDEDQAPLPNVRVRLRYDDRASRFEAVSDREGVFRIERLRPGSVTLDVIDVPTAALPDWVNLELESGSTHEVSLVAPSGCEVFGCITDALTGEPIADAEIGIGWTFDKPVRTDEHGRWRMRGIGGPFANNLHIRADGYRKTCIQRPSQATGEVEVNLELHAAIEVRGRVLDVDGTPAAGCYVASVGYDPLGIDWHAAITDEDGRYTITNVRTNGGSTLLVRHELRATSLFAVPLANSDLVVEMPDITLRKRRVLRGSLRVRGAPLADVTGFLIGCNDEAPTFLRGLGNCQSPMLLHYVARRKVITDARGRFVVGDLDAGSYELELNGALYPIQVEAKVDPLPLHIEE